MLTGDVYRHRRIDLVRMGEEVVLRGSRSPTEDKSVAVRSPARRGPLLGDVGSEPCLGNLRPRRMNAMRIELRFDTGDSQLAFDLFAPAQSLKPGITITTPGDGTIVLRETYMRKAFGARETIILLLDAGKDLGIALFASWLYDKLKGRAQKLRINRVEVEIEEGAIRKVITEHVERED